MNLRERVTVMVLNGWGPLCTRCYAQAVAKEKPRRIEVRKRKPNEKACVSCARAFTG